MSGDEPLLEHDLELLEAGAYEAGVPDRWLCHACGATGAIEGGACPAAPNHAGAELSWMEIDGWPVDPRTGSPIVEGEVIAITPATPTEPRS